MTWQWALVAGSKVWCPRRRRSAGRHLADSMVSCIAGSALWCWMLLGGRIWKQGSPPGRTWCGTPSTITSLASSRRCWSVCQPRSCIIWEVLLVVRQSPLTNLAALHCTASNCWMHVVMCGLQFLSLVRPILEFAAPAFLSLVRPILEFAAPAGAAYSRMGLTREGNCNTGL